MRYISSARIFTRWAVTMVGLVLVFAALQNDAAVSAILNFCLAGVVPGTSVVLAPNMVLSIVAGVLTLFTLVVVYKLVNWIWPRASKEILVPVPKTTNQYLGVGIRLRARIRFMRTLERIDTVRLGLGNWITRVLWRFWPIVTVIRVALRNLYFVTSEYATWVWRGIVRISVLSWRFASPYLWQFDSWLEIQVRKYRPKLNIRRFVPRSEVIVIVLATIKEPFKLFSASRMKPNPRSGRAGSSPTDQ